MLAMFGSGWENLVWAVQLCYFLSLLAFLAHLLLVDHEGRLDWRDGLAALIAIVGVASSGFGPFFLFGAAVMIALRRRWWALLTVVPAGLAWLWWFVVYSSDEASQRKPGSRARVPEFAINGIIGTFDALVGALPVTGLAILGCIGVLAWKRDQLGQLAAVFACTATAIVMFLGIGYERVGFGVTTASSSRYVGIAAVLLAPLLALAVDQLGRLGNPALIAGRVLLIVAIEVNAGKLWTIGSNWAQKSAGDRDLMELVAGSPQAAQVDPLTRPIPLNPDIRVRDLPRLVELGRHHAARADDAGGDRPRSTRRSAWRRPGRADRRWMPTSTAGWRRSSRPTGGTPRRGPCCSSCSPNGCRPGGRFLDVGGGTGATGAWLAEHGELVVADIEPTAVDSYRQHHTVAGAVAADLNALPFASASFDAVLCVTVLCHRAVPSPAHAVGELARVLRPGGLLCLQEPGVRRLRRAHDRVTHTGRRFSRGDLAGLVAGAGLGPRALDRRVLVPRPAGGGEDAARAGRDVERPRPQPGRPRGALGATASLERRVLRRVDLPAGLSVLAVGRRPMALTGRRSAATPAGNLVARSRSQPHDGVPSNNTAKTGRMAAEALPPAPAIDHSTLVVISATRNEHRSVPLVLAEMARARDELDAMGIALELLVVDDSDTPETAEELVSEGKLRDLGVTVIKGPGRGIGAAFVTGFRYALDAMSPTLLATMDCDGQHDATQLPILVQAKLAGDDLLVIGSRFAEGASLTGLTRPRKAISKVGNQLIRRLSHKDLPADATTSFRVFEPELARNFLRHGLVAGCTGYNFFSLFVLFAVITGPCREVPIHFRPRLVGSSKLTMQQCLQFARGLPDIGGRAAQWKRISEAEPFGDATDIGCLQELARMPNYQRWIVEEMEPWLHGSVLEVGAGIGNMTPFLAAAPDVTAVCALEPNADAYAQLSRACDGIDAATPVLGTVEVLGDQRFDTVVYINCLEHIRDEEGELQRVRAHLAGPDAHLIIFSPALEFLYGGSTA